jgi:tetratricopeptide (TPR) repeat protein/serine/threonine protein kinase
MEPPSIDRIYWDAAQIASDAERQAYLKQACAGDSRLHQQVEELLKVRSQAEAFLESPPHVLAGTVDEPVYARPGTTIGPYKLLEAIGEGGFAVVWMAQQQEPVRRKVALKLLKPGMDSKQVSVRFEAERQALAVMDHPNIARVLDGGATESGRPYFVMELVQGVPITRYCDQAQLSPRQRLELFVAVCRAVQHAHTKGVIHRDLKPSNVLVALYDDRPVVKVIDFGVAKATGQQLSEQSVHTGFGAVVGTVEYMSPEQAGFNQLDVDTRSDVYSLGVLLYELLTGTTPLESRRVKESGLLEALRLIREEEAPTLSHRLSTTEELATIAANRGLEPVKLRRLVRGELDWIVMKALEKERNRRYESASALAADIQRYRADEPVLARPQSVGYRLRKLFRRKKGVLTAVSFVSMLVLLLAGSVGWYFRDQHARQAEAAHESREFLKRARQLIGEDRLVEAHEELASAKARIGSEAIRLPHLLAEIESLEADLQRYQSFFHLIDKAHETEFRYPIAGEVRVSQRRDEDRRKSGDLLLQALSLYAVMEGKASNLERGDGSLEAHQVSRLRRNFYEALVWLANDVVLRNQDHCSGRDLSQQEAAQQALAYLHKAEMIFPPTSAFYHIRGLTRIKLGQREEGQADLKLAREMPATLALDHNLLGSAAYRARNKAEAVQHHLAALRVEANHYWTLMRLGYTLCDLGEDEQDYTAAVGVFSGCILKRPAHAHAYYCRGNAFQNLGRFDEAISDYTKAIELNPKLADAWHNRGALYCDRLGQPEKALADLSKALELEPKDAENWFNRGETYTELDQPQKALADYNKAIELEPKFVQALNNRGNAYAKLDRPEKALADYNKAIELAPTVTRAWWSRGVLYWNLGQLDKALADHTKAIEVEPDNAAIWHNRGLLYQELNELQKALADYTEAIELDPKYAQALSGRGSVYLSLNQPQKALADISKAIELDPKLARAWANRGTLYCDYLRKPEKALVDFSKAIELEPNKAEYWYNRGNAYSKLDEPQKALADYTKAIELNPNNFWHWYNRGNAYSKLNQPHKALADYTKAIELDPKHAQAWNNRGCVFEKLNQPHKALADYTKAIEVDPKLVQGWYNRACVHARLNQLQKALADNTKAIELAPTATRLWWSRATFYTRLGQWEKSLADYTEAIELEPNNAAIWLDRGRAYSRLDQVQKAVPDYRKAIEINPNCAEAHCNLGLALRDTGDLAEALKHLKRGHELGNRKPGWSYPSAEWVRGCEKLLREKRKRKEQSGSGDGDPNKSPP